MNKGKTGATITKNPKAKKQIRIVSDKTAATTQSNRLVTYVSDDVFAWVSEQANSMGMNESMFLRFLLLKQKKNA